MAGEKDLCGTLGRACQEQAAPDSAEQGGGAHSSPVPRSLQILFNKILFSKAGTQGMAAF